MATATELENDARFQFLLRMGDNCLVLSYRLSEWCGHAPALEEDIALANTALDLIGQAQLWLGLCGAHQGEPEGRLAHRHGRGRHDGRRGHTDSLQPWDPGFGSSSAADGSAGTNGLGSSPGSINRLG